MPNKKPINPFYVVLVVTGIAFCITAASYMLLILRSEHLAPRQATSPESENRLLTVVDRYGNWLFLGEIVILGVATVGAISTDQYWMRRALARRSGANLPADEATGNSAKEQKSP